MSAHQLSVTLLQHTPDPDRAVAIAGRLCYAPVSAAELQHEMSDEDVAKLVRILVRSGPSLGARARLVQLRRRRRLAAPARTSSCGTAWPATTSSRSATSTSGRRQLRRPAVRRRQRRGRGGVPRGDGAGARRLRQAGRARACAEGRTRESVQEDARFVLPNAAETKIVVTMNARELRHFFQVRCCNRAQWEISALAWQMRGMVKERRAEPLRGQRARLPLRHLPARAR